MTPSPNMPDALSYWKSLNPDAPDTATGAANPYGLGPRVNTPAPAAPAPGVGAYATGEGATPDAAAQPKPEGEKKPEKPLQYSVTDFLINQVPGSLKRTVQNIGSAIWHPANTIDSLSALTVGTLQAAARSAGVEMPEDESDRVAQAFKNHFAERYFGGAENFKKALYTDPVGVAMDLSTFMTGAGGAVRGLGEVADVANAARAAETLGAVGSRLSKVGEMTNPLYLPSKGAGAVVKAVQKATKPAATAAEDVPIPPFDVQGGNFAQEFDPFDPSTGSYKSPQPPQAPPSPAPESMQESVERLRKAWGVKPPKGSGLETPETPESPPAAAPPPKPATQPAAPPAPKPAGWKENWKEIAAQLAGAGVTGYAADLLTHHILGIAGGFGLGAGAVKYLPIFLKSEAGQQLLARLGPGSNAATVAGVAKDLVPALNTFHQSQLKQQSMGQKSVFDRAKGGMVNPELARIQRERLPRLGILGMLEGHK